MPSSVTVQQCRHDVNMGLMAEALWLVKSGYVKNLTFLRQWYNINLAFSEEYIYLTLMLCVRLDVWMFWVMLSSHLYCLLYNSYYNNMILLHNIKDMLSYCICCIEHVQ